jgi:phosphonopyruvate decarboxylase
MKIGNAEVCCRLKAEALIDLLKEKSIDYFTGVPDSLLSGLCDCLIAKYGIQPGRHIIAHNEGGCVALAAGYHLATGKTPCIYLQNSGIGNIINPAASLIHPKVYGIPMLFIVGWRGEPGTKDEPQHLYQGEATLAMLESVGICHFVLKGNTPPNELEAALNRFESVFAEGGSAAIVVGKGGLSGPRGNYANSYSLVREQVIRRIMRVAGDDILVSTTGKISRELFEGREWSGESHERDFLTVGSMGHSIMIALGIAQAKPEQRIWCIDGDGAVLMHTGALAIIGSQKPKNLVHIVLNNAAHESVGGAPTAAGSVDFSAAAKAFGFRDVFSVSTQDELEKALAICAAEHGPLFLEVKVALGSRDNLGRPTTTPAENKDAFMAYLRKQI